MSEGILEQQLINKKGKLKTLQEKMELNNVNMLFIIEKDKIIKEIKLITKK